MRLVKSVSAAALAVGLMMGSPAQAASQFVGSTATLDATDDFSWTVFFNGLSDATTVVPGLTSKIVFDFLSVTNAGKTYNFNYSITNTSSAPILTSRVSSFGFNSNPDIQGGTVSGVFNDIDVASSYPAQFGNIDICFNDTPGPTCNGGGGGGVDFGMTAGGSFSLTYANAPAGGIVTLDNFGVRYQSITGAGQVTSAVGRATRTPPPPPVPEPATWMMMLAGLGIIGSAMRRKRRITSFA